MAHVNVAGALRDMAAALDPDHEEELSLEVRRGDEAAVAELHVGVHLGLQKQRATPVRTPAPSGERSGGGVRTSTSGLEILYSPPSRSMEQPPMSLIGPKLGVESWPGK